MFHTNTLPRTSAADGMQAYGLSGIELGYRTQQYRAAAASDHQLREVEVRGRVNNIRQWLGDAMIRAGSGLGGRTATAPGTAIHPKTSMP